jgi:hypothetical protein
MFQLIENDGDYEAKIHSIHLEALPQLKVNISVYGKLIPSLKERNLNMVYDLQLETI